MEHYIDHKDKQGRPRTACGQFAKHVHTPTFWERQDFIDRPVNFAKGTGPTDRCPQCLAVAQGTKHHAPRTFDEYAALWAAKIYDFGQERETWTRLASPLLFHAKR